MKSSGVRDLVSVLLPWEAWLSRNRRRMGRVRGFDSRDRVPKTLQC